MNIYSVNAKNLEERGRMVELLQGVLKKYLLETLAVILISPENELVLKIVADSACTEKQKNVLKATAEKIYLHLPQPEKAKPVQVPAPVIPTKQEIIPGVGIRTFKDGTPYINGVHEDIFWSDMFAKREREREEWLAEQEFQSFERRANYQ